MTAILAMPLVQLTVETGNNEDWIDSIKFVTDDGSLPADMPQLDIRGIIFEMEVRRAAGDHEVLFSASTEDGTLIIGSPPDFGFLTINIPIEIMNIQTAGVYVADITGRDNTYTRVVVQITALTVVDGITKQPVISSFAVAVAA